MRKSSKPLQVTSTTTSNGVCERRFTLDDIPGVLWSPADGVPRSPAGGDGWCPLVLLAHGGGQHKMAPGVAVRAHRYVTGYGFAVAAIDAPGHGDRPTAERDERWAAIRERVAAGEPLAPMIVRYNTELSAQAIPEWQAVLDAVQDVEDIGTGGPVGFWGLSMGAAIGVPLVAVESRITAAVFGLVGGETLIEAAANVTVPVEFLLQWDDEVVPRAESLALFDALASAEKSLHANTGRHIDVPRFEVDSSERFFARHLVTATLP
jgi:dienelactone hydrolase